MSFHRIHRTRRSAHPAPRFPWRCKGQQDPVRWLEVLPPCPQHCDPTHSACAIPPNCLFPGFTSKLLSPTSTLSSQRGKVLMAGAPRILGLDLGPSQQKKSLRGWSVSREGNGDGEGAGAPGVAEGAPQKPSTPALDSLGQGWTTLSKKKFSLYPT